MVKESEQRLFTKEVNNCLICRAFSSSFTHIYSKDCTENIKFLIADF
jgi:hypothetical protein